MISLAVNFIRTPLQVIGTVRGNVPQSSFFQQSAPKGAHPSTSVLLEDELLPSLANGSLWCIAEDLMMGLEAP